MAKLTDFGIVKDLDPSADLGASTTLVGTWAYASPEQTEGQRHQQHEGQPVGAVADEIEEFGGHEHRPDDPPGDPEEERDPWVLGHEQYEDRQFDVAESTDGYVESGRHQARTDHDQAEQPRELDPPDLGLEVAGVDMLESKSGPKILEINSSPGLEGIERATSVDVADVAREATGAWAPPPFDVERRLALPVAVDAGRVEARLVDGVLDRKSTRLNSSH